MEKWDTYNLPQQRIEAMKYKPAQNAIELRGQSHQTCSVRKETNLIKKWQHQIVGISATQFITPAIVATWLEWPSATCKKEAEPFPKERKFWSQSKQLPRIKYQTFTFFQTNWTASLTIFSIRILGNKHQTDLIISAIQVIESGRYLLKIRLFK